MSIIDEIKMIRDADAAGIVQVEIPKELWELIRTLCYSVNPPPNNIKIGHHQYIIKGCPPVNKIIKLIDEIEKDNSSYSDKIDNPRVDLLNQLRGIISKM